jgi:lysophospholipase L1-like esterase
MTPAYPSPRNSDPRLSWGKRVVFSLAALVFSSVLVLCVLEAGLWLTDKLLKKPPNDMVSVTWGHVVRNNALGFREREFSMPKTSGTFRIMVLGDSLTWGAGLGEEERYSHLLEEKLRAAVGKAGNVEVLNFGRSATATVDQEKILASQIQVVNPDLVVVGFCVNDAQTREESYAVELENYQWLFRWIRKLGRLGFHRTANVLNLRVDQLLRSVGLVPSYNESLDRAYQVKSAEWQGFTAALRDMYDTAMAHTGRAPVFITLLQGSTDYNVSSPYVDYMLRWTRLAGAAAREAGFRFLETETAFKREGFRSRWVTAWDGHPDATCNRHYADILFDEVIKDVQAPVATQTPDRVKVTTRRASDE